MYPDCHGCAPFLGICDRSGTTADANDRRPDTGRSYLNRDFLLGEPPARVAGVVQRGRTVLWRLWEGSASGIILPVLNVRGGVNLPATVSE